MTGIARPSTPCIHPGCRSLTTRGAYCDEHRQARAREHNAKREQTYHTHAWKQARATAIARQHGCNLAHYDTCRGPLHAHHQNGDSTDHRQENLVVLCERHHMRIEREANTGPLHRALDEARHAVNQPGARP